MKKRVLAATVALAVSIVAAGVCFAHPQVLEVNIPFAFEAGNKMLPAGQYKFESVPTGDGTLYRIRRMDGDAQSLVSSIALTTGDRQNLPKLVFHKYGTTYFLAQIWNGDGGGRQLFESKQEKEVARAEKRTEVALSMRRTRM
jgi:hypothetical protein